jgi:hypothetical protein
MKFVAWMLSGLVVCSCCGQAGAQSPDDWLRTIKRVDHKAAGNAEAAKAYDQLIKGGRETLPAILSAFEDANPLAENYLRSAFEVVAEKGAGEPPQAEITKFLRERSHNQNARALAFEWLKSQDADAAESFLDESLLDPSSEIRRLAVARKIEQAESAEGDAAIAAWRAALSGAIDQDQVKQVADALKAAGEEVDLARHFGLLTEWKIIGPFDNKDMKAFDVAYPPEREIDFSATYEGMTGEVGWQTITTDDPFGKVDIAKSVGPHKGAVMYMYAEFDSPEAGEAWFRLATANAWKLWVNGELVFAREEYHRGMRWDQYRVPAALKQGKNVLRLKILQNEQTQDWAQTYSVQFRVCNKEGVAILPTQPYRAALDTVKRSIADTSPSRRATSN